MNHIPVELYDEPLAYIRENYIPDAGESAGAAPAIYRDVEKGVDSLLPKQDAARLETLVDEIGETFSQMLLRLIDERGLSDVDVYKEAGIDRKHFSKIRSNPSYHPRKSTILAFAIALKLDLAETVDLLTRAEYALSPGSKGDLIVKFFIEHEIYDLDTINYVLDEYGQPILR